MLEQAGTIDPRLEAEYILEHVTGRDRLSIRLNAERVPTEKERERFFALVRRCAAGEPLAYVIGVQEFMSLPFRVGPGVLIPRPETEILVEKALEWLEGREEAEGLDVGTGCGCIAVSLLVHARCDLRFTAVDVSPRALEAAGENAAMHRVDHRIEFMVSDVFSALPRTHAYDVITANLPYVSDEEFPYVHPQVRNHEPPEAVRGGRDGLDLIRRFTADAWRFLKPGGACFIEIGYTQAEAVCALFEAAGRYGGVRVFRDYGGRDRVVAAERRA